MSEEEVICFELNDWMPKQDYSDETRYELMCCYIPNATRTSFALPLLLRPEFVEKHKLVVVSAMIDMSTNFCVTAKRSWVEKEIPDLLTTYKEFVRCVGTNIDFKILNSEGEQNAPFLPYSEENIGIHFWDPWSDSWINQDEYERGDNR